MSVLDERIADGLRNLVDRAPVGADIWPATEQYVAKHKRYRDAIAIAVGLAPIGRPRRTRHRLWNTTDRRLQQ